MNITNDPIILDIDCHSKYRQIWFGVLVFSDTFSTNRLDRDMRKAGEKHNNVKLKSAQRDTNLRAGTLQPDRTF